MIKKHLKVKENCSKEMQPLTFLFHINELDDNMGSRYETCL